MHFCWLFLDYFFLMVGSCLPFNSIILLLFFFFKKKVHGTFSRFIRQSSFFLLFCTVTKNQQKLQILFLSDDIYEFCDGYQWQLRQTFGVLVPFCTKESMSFQKQKEIRVSIEDYWIFNRKLKLIKKKGFFLYLSSSSSKKKCWLDQSWTDTPFKFTSLSLQISEECVWIFFLGLFDTFYVQTILFFFMLNCCWSSLFYHANCAFAKAKHKAWKNWKGWETNTLKYLQMFLAFFFKCINSLQGLPGSRL